jgi:hypothetical protein
VNYSPMSNPLGASGWDISSNKWNIFNITNTQNYTFNGNNIKFTSGLDSTAGFTVTNSGLYSISLKYNLYFNGGSNSFSSISIVLATQPTLFEMMETYNYTYLYPSLIPSSNQLGNTNLLQPLQSVNDSYIVNKYLESGTKYIFMIYPEFSYTRNVVYGSYFLNINQL